MDAPRNDELLYFTRSVHMEERQVGVAKTWKRNIFVVALLNILLYRLR